ncbi:cysteine-rich with EGF-like domain protein 2 isoform X1 [Drosophila pseudoobscura]|uniref:Cysteine-rich with EGF-like domain protein 2 isoform X1 n=1 Tax=Drosophila pseudoobscura pseudoobscura TaxID=46245 RepID=Q29NR0_DROPS|nr:cysteine-rich with EGF-like domain protein 2 isoform X1 [Drosophila pseudoobscura]
MLFINHYSTIMAFLALAVASTSGDKATPPPCKACSLLATSFKVGLERTKRGHGGGDTAWEEEKLRSYKNSEVRLVEIQERLCSEAEVVNKDHCHNLANEHEAAIEDWFTHKQAESPDLQSWLCIEQLSVCCPPNTYGPNCLPCSECSGNGKCKGAGTRKGNGKCLCDAGYAGSNCKECALQYYESFRDEKKLLCTQCHAACGDGGCTGAGPKSCRKCKDGWHMDSETGCVDINECLDQQRPTACRPQQFCVNNEGSFSCLECDRSCNGCDGDGPDMCKQCADGFVLKDGKCQDQSAEERDSYVNFTRLLTYFGMCVATCVIFQSSTHIGWGCVVGAAVAVYIAASEYWLNSPQAGHKPEIDTKQLEELIMKSL